jgi:biopolymer transport protein ExbB
MVTSIRALVSGSSPLAGRHWIITALLAAIALLSVQGSRAQDPASSPPAKSPGTSAAAKSPGGAAAAPASKQEAKQPSVADIGFWGLIQSAGWIGHTIILLSVAAAALVFEHLWSIRARAFMPPGLADQVREHLKSGQENQALQQCKLRPSFLARVLEAGLTEMGGKWTTLEKAMEDVTAEQSARMMRKIEYLAVIANLAPMLGLLGTVVGLIVAFQEVASTGGRATAADLAQGIYLALVTTVEGLVVAIPALGAYAVFRNRIDQLVAETAYAAIGVFQPFKRGGRSGDTTAREEVYRGQPSRPPS